MSHWTHITRAIYVDTYEERRDIKSYVEDILSKAPSITGSERNADVFVNVLSGHNTSTNMDCSRCPAKDTIHYYEDGGWSCEPPVETPEEVDNYQCPWGEYQTQVVITIVGNLRDRELPRTQKEYQRFKKYLHKQGWWLRQIACNIEKD